MEVLLMSMPILALPGPQFWVATVLLLLLATPLPAKTQVDFNPEINFEQFKTFAYLGGINKLVMQQLNPDLLSDRVHRSVTRELTAKGLREVKPDENPDLVVRYWATSSKDADTTWFTNFGVYEPYIGSYWGFWYNTISTTTRRQGTLTVDLIDPKKKDLVWRVYIVRKITNVDKVWKQADEDFTKGFGSFPPSTKEIEDKKKERAEHPPKTASLQQAPASKFLLA
jgi:Domain of unknown function (DUF4136)